MNISEVLGEDIEGRLEYLESDVEELELARQDIPDGTLWAEMTDFALMIRKLEITIWQAVLGTDE